MKTKCAHSGCQEEIVVDGTDYPFKVRKPGEAPDFYCEEHFPKMPLENNVVPLRDRKNE